MIKKVLSLLFILISSCSCKIKPISYDIDDIPCSALPSGYQNSFYIQPANNYVTTLIRYCCDLEGIDYPNGIYEAWYINNAYYIPDKEYIFFDPFWLNNLYNQTGFLEAGDSIIFHETGHHWSFETGRQQAIYDNAIDFTEYSWKSEFQADSFAGYILKTLGGNPSVSVNIYVILFANWSETHPPGIQRAEVFYNSWSNGIYFDYTSRIIEKREILNKIEDLIKIKNILIQEGLNPYSNNSNKRFLELKKGILME